MDSLAMPGVLLTTPTAVSPPAATLAPAPRAVPSSPSTAAGGHGAGPTGAVISSTDSTTQSHLPRVPRTPEMLVKVRDCPTTRMPIELCYQCFGDPADGLPVVLLIGGLNMQMYAWDENFCESLVRAGFFVVRYDNRDIGHSTKVENCGKIKVPILLLPGRAAKWLGEELPYRLDDMAADAWALLDALHVPCAHLFGISMGGMIAQLAALQAPERTISLTSVMSSTNSPDLPQPALWVKLWMLRRPPRNCTVEELLEFRVHSLRHLLRFALPPDGEYLKRRFLMSLRRSSYAAGLVRQAAAIRRCTGRDAQLQRLHVPALVVHGAQDVVVPPMNGYRTATMLPYARMLVLKSMGHYFHPAFFSTIIAAFADMAASTDPARRPLRPALPSVSAMELPSSPDGDGEELAPRQDGGTAPTDARDHANPAHPQAPANATSAAHTDPAAELSPEEAAAAPAAVPAAAADASDGGAPAADVEPGAGVDPRTRMMASLGEFIVPVVADAASPIGRAVCGSVMVAVPGGNSNPAVPEAVIVENLFQRDPHATPTVPRAAVVKRPASPTPQQGGGKPSAAAATPAPRMLVSPLADVSRRPGDPTPPRSPSTSLSNLPTVPAGAGHRATPAPPPAAPPAPAPMNGATPFVPCSPSRWYEIEPFPQRRAASQASDAAPRKLPAVHPIVCGVPVDEYLRTHAAASKPLGEASGVKGKTAVAAAATAPVRASPDASSSSAASPAAGPLQASLVEAPAVAAVIAGSADGARSTAAAAAAAALAGDVGGEQDDGGLQSSASDTPSADRRADEEFLHSEAPLDVVEASSFSAL